MTGPTESDPTGPAGGPRPMGRADWDDRYRSAELVWGAEPNRFLLREVGGMTPGSALDVACGEGRNAIWLAAKGWRVTAVDFSPVALARAATLAADRGLDVAWKEADVTVWDPPTAYDLVVVLYLHLVAPLRRLVLRRSAERVAPEGVLLVVAHDRTNLTEGTGGPQDPAVLYGPDDVVADLGGLLSVERAERARRPVSTPDGEVDAIDLLVRARRPGPG